jgi:hypothetical protein
MSLKQIWYNWIRSLFINNVNYFVSYNLPMINLLVFIIWNNLYPYQWLPFFLKKNDIQNSKAKNQVIMQVCNIKDI